MSYPASTVITLMLVAPGIALLLAYVWAREDASKGNAAAVLQKVIFVLGMYLIVSGFIAARQIPPPGSAYPEQQFGGPPPGYAPP